MKRSALIVTIAMLLIAIVFITKGWRAAVIPLTILLIPFVYDVYEKNKDA